MEKKPRPSTAAKKKTRVPLEEALDKELIKIEKSFSTGLKKNGSSFSICGNF